MNIKLRTSYVIVSVCALLLPFTVLKSQSGPKNSKKAEPTLVIQDRQEANPTRQIPIEKLEQYKPDGNKKPKYNPFDSRLELANLILRGKVIGKRYAKSTNPGPLQGAPVTFVDFEVLDVIAGSFEGSVFTVRHLGGPRGDGETYLVPSHINHFNIGDEEILYLYENGQSMDPVLARFRVLDDVVHSVGGKRLVQDAEKNVMVSGDVSDAETVKKVKIETLEVPTQLIHNPDPADQMESNDNCKSSDGCYALGRETARDQILASISRKPKNFMKLEKSADIKAHLKFSDPQ